VTPSLAINYTAYGTLRSTWCQLRGEHEPTARPVAPTARPSCGAALALRAPGLPGRCLDVVRVSVQVQALLP